MFRPRICDIIDPDHPLVKLAAVIDREVFEKHLDPCFCDAGRQAKPVRLMVGLQYLKFTFDHSDDTVLEAWVENPYWQHFCGGVFFEHTPPIDSSSMTKWRAYLRQAGAEQMLAETIRTGMRGGVIKPCDLHRVNVDTTVQEKNIRFPTDARLLDRARERLVRCARAQGIALRQSYARVGKRTLRRHSGYAHAKQFRRARREEKRLRTVLARVVRDIERKCEEPSGALGEELAKAHRLLVQKNTDRGKLHSLHEPGVQCIAKGKAHRRYEFGCKVGLVTSAKSNWILGAQAFEANPYDGHTLALSLEQCERLTGVAPRQAVCDLGYRGHGYTGGCDIQIVQRRRRGLGRAMRRWWQRRLAIEPVIGHTKSDHRMDRNRLAGARGDKLNATLSACGFNLRKLLREFACALRHLWAALAKWPLTRPALGPEAAWTA